MEREEAGSTSSSSSIKVESQILLTLNSRGRPLHLITLPRYC